MKTIKRNPIKLDIYSNGSIHGLVIKRNPTLKETMYIFKKIFGICINEREDMDTDYDYNDYNKDLVNDFIEWLNGNRSDQSIMDYAYDCADDALVLINMIPLLSYLQKRNII